MQIATIGALALYAFVMSITPGPNNMLLANAGLVFGFRSTIPQIVGIPTGVISQILLVTAGLSSLFAQFPSIQLALKVAGTCYLLWLALKLWKADALAQSPNATPISFSQAMLFQFINPKSWLIALTAVSAFLQPEKAVLPQLLIICLAFALIGTPCMAVWSAMGSALRRHLSSPTSLRRANRTLAALASATCLMFWL